MKIVTIRAALLAAGLVVPVALSPLAVHAQGALRPAIGKPLAKAKSLFAAHNYGAAMAQVRIADNVPGKSGAEQFVINEMRGAIAQQSGDHPTAERTYADMLSSGMVPASEQVRLLTALASMYYQDKNYAQAIVWIDRYHKAGGNDASMQVLLIQSYYESHDYANAGRLEADAIAATERARHAPTENQLQLLAACQEQTKDKAGFFLTMQKLVYYYPKSDYWLNLLHSVQGKPGFSDRMALDLDRLRMAAGVLTSPDDYLEMAQLAVVSGSPGEAKSVVDQGYTKGILGTGPAASRHARLKALVDKTAGDRQKLLGTEDAAAASEHDGNHLQALGEEYVSFGQTQKGIAAMEQAKTLGGLRHPEDSQLHLALGYWQAGQKSAAISAFRQVGGSDGASDLAKLWVLKIGR